MRKSVKVQTLDTTFAKALKESYDYICQNNKCEYCGNMSLRAGGAECSHHHPRRHRAGRWNPDNCVCLCHDFHSQLDLSPQRDQVTFMEAHLGEIKYEDLMVRLHGTVKYTPYNRWEMNVHYAAQWKYMKRLRLEGRVGTLPLAAWD